MGDPSIHNEHNDVDCSEINNANSFSVCLVEGRPTIRVLTQNTQDRWLFDTGAGMTVISEQLYNRMNPKPKLSSANFNCTGANKKPVNLLGIARNLSKNVLNEDTKVDVLVSPELSFVGILGMDVIRKLNIVLNPRTLKFSKIKDSAVCALSLQTYRVPPLCGRPIKVKVTGPLADGNAVVSTLQTPIIDKLFVPEAMAAVHDNVAIIMVKNCNTHEIVIPAKSSVCNIEFIHENDITINATEMTHPTDVSLPPPLNAKDAKSFIKRIKMNVPDAQRAEYVSLFLKNYDIFSTDKSDLGRANNFEHNIRLHSSDPIYRKQFRIPEAHQESLNTQIDEWLKMGIIEPCFSRFNSPIFIVPKKDGTFRFVLDYRALNENSLDDRYNMKDVGECIGEIGRAGSTIFSTMDLTSGFWQLPLEEKSRTLTAFTCPGKGQFCYKVLSMGLKGGPGSFQRMMELTMKNISNVIVYIDDLLVHTATHKHQIQTLQLVFNRLRNVNLKLNPEKCEFGATSVQYLGFRLTPKGILPGKDKLQAVRDMSPPTTVTEVRQFLGLCNYFRTHVRNFSMIAGPLNFLTSKKAGWRGGPLPLDAKTSFDKLKKALISEPVVAYPRADRQYHLYVDAATGGINTSGGFGAVLGQPDDKGELHVVAFASRSLKDHERNYTPYLAELSAAAWAIDHFDVYLRGRRFILYTDHKPMVIKKSIHTKTLNRLEEKMGLYDFQLVYKKGNSMPADVLSRKPVDAINATDDQNSYLIASRNDVFCQDIERYLNSQTLPSDAVRAKIISQLGPHFFKENEVLKLHANEGDLIILPQSLANAAIDNAHGTLLTGHGGIDKTVARIRQLYYWPSIIVDVKQRLSECPRCQKALKSKPSGESLHPLPLCSEPNQRIHCDLFGPLKTLDGKAHVLCITDAFTKYAELCVVINKEASSISTAIISNWICRFGIPGQIMTDGGKEFANKLLDHICKTLNIAKNKTTPAHPQCNAQVEIVNKSIKKYLATMTDNALDWIPLIPTLAFAYNTSVHNTTGFSPAHLMFGYQPKYVTDPILPDGHGTPTDNLLRHLFLNRQLATKTSLRKTDQYKRRHDKGISETVINPGQFVFLDRRMFLNTNEKIEDKWEGPYLVTKVFPNGTLDIIRKGRSIRVNKQRVKPFTAMGQVKTRIPNLPPQQHDDMTTNTKTSDFLSSDSDTDDDFSPLPPNLTNNSSNPPSSSSTSATPSQPSLPDPTNNTPPVSTSKRRGRPRKDTSTTSATNPPTPPANISPDNVPTTTNNKYGTHPMILRQRTDKPTVSHLKIASLVTHENIPKVKRLNAILIRKFAKHINHLASITVLDEYALPKQVTNQSTAKQIDRRRKYLKSLSPAQRNTLLTGDPLFCFDPVVYEYVWSTGRPDLPADLLAYFEHLPDVPDLPGGQLLPADPPPPRPASAPLFLLPDSLPPQPSSSQNALPDPRSLGAIPRPPRPHSAPRQRATVYMDVDPRIEYPPDSLPYPESFYPPEYQPYVPPAIPALPHPQPCPPIQYVTPQPHAIQTSQYPALSYIPSQVTPATRQQSLPQQPYPPSMQQRTPSTPALQFDFPIPLTYQPTAPRNYIQPARFVPNLPHPHNTPPTTVLYYPDPPQVFSQPPRLETIPPINLPLLGPPPLRAFSGNPQSYDQYPLTRQLSHATTVSNPPSPITEANYPEIIEDVRELQRLPYAMRPPSPPAAAPPSPPTPPPLPPHPLTLPAPTPPAQQPQNLNSRVRTILRRFPSFRSSFRQTPTSTTTTRTTTPASTFVRPTPTMSRFQFPARPSQVNPLPSRPAISQLPQVSQHPQFLTSQPLPDDDTPMPPSHVYHVLPYAGPQVDRNMSVGSTISNPMSFGSQSSSDSSMRSQGDPMEVQHRQPFDAIPGPQFRDLRPRASNVPPIYNFSGFRENRSHDASAPPSAPRFVDEYGRPFIQWPPVRTTAPLPPAPAGTFDNLRISDPTPALHAPNFVTPPVNPAFLPGPVFARQPSMVHRPTQPAIAYHQPAIEFRDATPAIAWQVPPNHQQPSENRQLVPRPDGTSRHRMIRDPSIDAVHIDALAFHPHQDHQSLMDVSPLPPPLTRLEKLRAFLGDESLLLRHAYRQLCKRASRPRYKRFS